MKKLLVKEIKSTGYGFTIKTEPAFDYSLTTGSISIPITAFDVDEDTHNHCITESSNCSSRWTSVHMGDNVVLSTTLGFIDGQFVYYDDFWFDKKLKSVPAEIIPIGQNYFIFNPYCEESIDVE